MTVTAFSQKKKRPQPPATVGSSPITKNDKWEENFSLKKEKFTVYCGYQAPSVNLEQKKNDTLIQYKIALYRTTYSHLKITKLATQNGKIIREGYYTLKNDTLMVVTNHYNYYHANRITDIYVVDKYRYLDKISDKIEEINTDSLPERYLKTVKLPGPPLPQEN